MLCGLPDAEEILNGVDLDYSSRVFKDHEKMLPSYSRAIDVGGGIGRVTEALLGLVFDEIDIVDISER